MTAKWIDRHTHIAGLIESAIDAVDPYLAVKKHIYLAGDTLTVGERVLQLTPNARVFVVGAGKAGAAMALAAEEVVGARLAGGVVSVDQLPHRSPRTIKIIRGGHPIPNRNSVLASRQMQTMLREGRAEDIVLAVISGGGSALLELPVRSLRLQDLQRTTEALLWSGAAIQEVNVVRKELSQTKGGGLARMAAPATVVGLILSDVVGDSLEAIASGPTVPKHTSEVDALAVVRRYGLSGTLPRRVVEYLSHQANGLSAGPQPANERVHNVLIGNNAIACVAASRKARRLGFHSRVLTSSFTGEAREVGGAIAALAMSPDGMKLGLRKPACLILGGESTVTVRGRGKGGRNQELALAASIALSGAKNTLVLSLATDGVDGTTPAAGAYVTGQTLTDFKAAALDPVRALANNDSHTLLDALGQTICTGPTGTNVGDIVFVLNYDR